MTDKYLLQNLENYNKELEYTHSDVFLKYVEVLNNYLILSIENIQIQNEEYKKYIIKKGLETIEHIFSFILYYTLNPGLTLYYCEQGFIYYIEFIGQMIISGDNTLSLSIKDSILFVYKKTIFDVSKEYRENYDLNDTDNKKIKTIKHLSSVYKNILFLYIDGLNFNNQKQILIHKESNVLKNIVINVLCNEFENETFPDSLNTIDYFVNFIKLNDDLSLYNKLNIIEIFIKKFNKYGITLDILQCKLQMDMVLNILNNETYNTSTSIKLFYYLFN